jgi:hypothetical protein
MEENTMIIAKNGNALNREIGSEAYNADHIYMYNNNMENIYMADLSDRKNDDVFVFGGKIDRYMSIEDAYDLLNE